MGEGGRRECRLLLITIAFLLKLLSYHHLSVVNRVLSE